MHYTEHYEFRSAGSIKTCAKRKKISAVHFDTEICRQGYSAENTEQNKAKLFADEIHTDINGSNDGGYGMMVEQRTIVDMTLSCVNA